MSRNSAQWTQKPKLPPTHYVDSTVALDGDAPRLLARHGKLDTRDLGWGHHIPF